MFMGETCPWTHLILAEIMVLAGGVVPPAPPVPASTRVYARLKRVREHSSPVNVCTCFVTPGCNMAVLFMTDGDITAGLGKLMLVQPIPPW